MTFNQVQKRLKAAGWIVKNQRGSHVQMTHPQKSGKITIPKHGNRDLKPGTLKAILKHAGLSS